MVQPLPSHLHAPLTRLWTLCACDGLAPYKAVEQLSFLLALNVCEEERQARAATLWSWNALLTVADEHLISAVEAAMGWLRELDPSGTGLFHTASVSISRASVLREVMHLVDLLFALNHSREMWASLYERFLSLAEEAAARWAQPGGKFYTPPHIAHLLCSLVRPQPGERICDYACGNGRLLAAAYRQVARTWSDSDLLQYTVDGQPLPESEPLLSVEQQNVFHTTRYVGIDIDKDAALQAWILLRCLGDRHPMIFAHDALSRHCAQHLDASGMGLGSMDVLLANPPYSSRVDRATLDSALQAYTTSKAELLFMERALQMLRPGGRAAIIVPESVLFHQSTPAVALRKKLVAKHGLQAIVSLPVGIFAPFTKVKTSLLLFTHSGAPRETIWSYQVERDGYTLQKRRLPQPEHNDLPDLFIQSCLQFQGSLSSCRSSAFINGDTQLQWENIAPQEWLSHYAQPLIEPTRSAQEQQDEPVGRRWKGTMAVPLSQPKQWEIPVDQLDELYTLLPERYRPLSPRIAAHGCSPRPSSTKQRGGIFRLLPQTLASPIRLVYVQE